jgi:UDP-N-acetylglucosamine 2-epimerase
MDLKKIKNPYGNGDSSIKIVKILKKLDYTKAINKIISY